MRGKPWWILGGVVGIGLLLLSSSKTEPTGSEIATTGADLDNLARMLIAETSFSRDPSEMAQIVWVAINRARKRGSTLSKVVVPPGAPDWNASSLYRDRFNAADRDAKFAAARAFVAGVLAGQYPNLIGDRTLFVHPGGMPVPPCAANRVASSTAAGTRCLPTWAVNGVVVGGAVFA